MEVSAQNQKTRFGPFELDLRSGELRKHGIRVKLQDQPFQILALLLERSGDVVTREELHLKLWPADTFVDFETGLNSAVKKLRDVLGDSAEAPSYVETFPKRGYRFIGHIENGNSAGSAAAEAKPQSIPLDEKARALPKSRRVAFVAGVAGLLVVAGLFAWRAFFSSTALAETDVILLADFVNKTGDPIFENSLDKALEVKLTESPYLSLLPEADVRTTMRMMRHNPDERVTRELGIEICKRQGLKAVIVPEIDAVGSKYLITLEAVDAQSQKTIARQQKEAENKNQVIAALGAAGSQLRKRLGESLSSLERYDAPLDQATTGSLEALQAYRTGLTLYRSGKRPQGIAFFEKAVDLDPQFCSAYGMLGSAYHSVRNEEDSRKNFARAFELMDGRVTQEEKFQTTALYHASITGNLEKEIAELTLYKQVYPRSVFASNLLGIAYAQSGKTEEALQQFYWAIDHSPVPSAQYYSNAGQALMILGRLDEAKKVLDEWGKKGSLTPFQITERYELAFFDNDHATMDGLDQAALPDDVSFRHFQMELSVFRGDIHKLRSISEDLVQRHIHGNRMENAFEELAWHGVIESGLENYSLAQTLCRQARDMNQHTASGLMMCAQAFANSGDIADAEAFAAKLDQLRPEDTYQQNMSLPIIRAIIERKRGNGAKAVELLAPLSIYTTALVYYQRGQAYLAAGEYASAGAEFTKVIEHRGWVEWALFVPRAKLGLARAYAMQGDREKSRKAYEDFFTTWKDADQDIPMLQQAKGEYKKLNATTSASAATHARAQ
jgi:DNA-binding winged helix-turn-helix (wHTH) protein/tetratricopeptide (TPR) repeat protein